MSRLIMPVFLIAIFLCFSFIVAFLFGLNPNDSECRKITYMSRVMLIEAGCKAGKFMGTEIK